MNFTLYLNPPRPGFAFDMNEDERSAMTEHIAYWKELMDSGIAIAFGPVMDPAGPYGLGLVEVDSEEQLKAILANDPATRYNKYEYYPMRLVKPGK